tara:strand:+ start:363 stop:473 length:111 start_codon:yes stop_codon:yes gene_type:complete
MTQSTKDVIEDIISAIPFAIVGGALLYVLAITFPFG